MMWWGHGWSWEGMLFGGLMMLFFWGGLIALAVVVIRGLASSSSRQLSDSSGSSESALDILKRRYARGEISKAEYEEMRRDLRE
jgi:putative membrane protein